VDKFCGKDISSVFPGGKDQGENGIPMTVTNAARREGHEEKTGWLTRKR